MKATLSAEGEITSPIQSWEPQARPGFTVTKFEMLYTFVRKGQPTYWRFFFVAFGELGRWIAYHYHQGKRINVKRARPYRDTKHNPNSIFALQWVVEEIVEFRDAPLPPVGGQDEGADGTIERVFVDDDETY